MPWQHKSQKKYTVRMFLRIQDCIKKKKKSTLVIDNNPAEMSESMNAEESVHACTRLYCCMPGTARKESLSQSRAPKLQSTFLPPLSGFDLLYPSFSTQNFPVTE